MTIWPGNTAHDSREPLNIMGSFYLPNSLCLVNIRAPDFPKVDHENV